MIRDKKHFAIGFALLVTFIAVLMFIFSPSFGDGMNGLQFSDDTFNKLSKGSSYFIPKIIENNKEYIGKEVSSKFKVETPEIADSAAMLFKHAGAEVEVNDTELSVKGDLGKLLGSALEDADSMFNNEGAKVLSKYGFDDGSEVVTKWGGDKADDPDVKGEKLLLNSWWQALNKMQKKLAIHKQVEESNMVGQVNKKAIEPGYNYFGVEAVKVSERSMVLGGLLLFYILYTLWFGFAIFYLFEGMGLSMEKSEAKAEV